MAPPSAEVLRRSPPVRRRHQVPVALSFISVTLSLLPRP
jgi:hypothetical protein